VSDFTMLSKLSSMSVAAVLIIGCNFSSVTFYFSSFFFGFITEMFAHKYKYFQTRLMPIKPSF